METRTVSIDQMKKIVPIFDVRTDNFDVTIENNAFINRTNAIVFVIVRMEVTNEIVRQQAMEHRPEVQINVKLDDNFVVKQVVCAFQSAG